MSILGGCTSPVFIDHLIAQDIHGFVYTATDTQSGDVVIMLCGGSGYSEEYARVANSLTDRNYHVVIIDYYGGGDDWGGHGIDTPETIERYHQNVRDGILWVRNDSEIDPEDLFILGFSYGATIGINIAAERDDIDAVVDFYGSMYMGVHDDLSPSEFVPQLPPVLLIYGDRDRVVSSDDAAEMMHLLEQYGIPHQEVVVPGMVHGFVTDETQRAVVDADIDIADSWFRDYEHHR